jgi:hypothetical protein
MCVWWLSPLAVAWSLPTAPLGLWAPHLTSLKDVSVGEWGGGALGRGGLSPEAEGRVVA